MIGSIIRFVLRWPLLICGGVLICAAAAHRLQLNLTEPQAYTSSPLVGVEMILMITLLILLVISPLYAIFLMLKQQWLEFGILAINVVIGIVCLVVAWSVDAPTLLYMT